MSGGARIGLVVAAVVAIVVAFVLLSPGGDDEPTTASTTTVAKPDQTPTTTPDQTPTSGVSPATEPVAPAAAPPAAEFTKVRVQGGKPAGAIRTITVKKGERARIQVSSQDTTDEIHLHGYDLKRDLQAGGSVRFSFDADAEGIFEMELEGAGVQIAKLVVEP